LRAVLASPRLKNALSCRGEGVDGERVPIVEVQKNRDFELSPSGIDLCHA